MPGQAFEALWKILNSLFDEEPKPPLHVGEVMACWTYLTILEESVVLEQLAINSTNDTELISIVNKTIGGASSQVRRLKDFMQREGIVLPSASEPKPVSNPNAVPLGAKMTENEIANFVSVKIASAVTLCGSAIAQTIRNDVALMFFEFQVEAMQYGTILKSIMRKRGWLKVPPYYLPPGLPQ